VQTSVSAANGRVRIWYRLAVVYFVLGTGLGVFMGISTNFALAPVHTHLSLLGWVSLALTGLLYERFPSAVNTRLYSIHFWAYNVTLPVAMVILAFVLTGHSGLEAAAGIATLFLFASIVVFAVNIWRSSSA
jgi:hypothetical protein